MIKRNLLLVVLLISLFSQSRNNLFGLDAKWAVGGGVASAIGLLTSYKLLSNYNTKNKVLFFLIINIVQEIYFN